METAFRISDEIGIATFEDDVRANAVSLFPGVIAGREDIEGLRVIKHVATTSDLTETDELAAACRLTYNRARILYSDIAILHSWGETASLANWDWNKALPELPSETKDDIPDDCTIEPAVWDFVAAHLKKESLKHAVELTQRVFIDRESMAVTLDVDPEIEGYSTIVVEVCTKMEMLIALELEESWHEKLVREFPTDTAHFLCLNVVLV